MSILYFIKIGNISAQIDLGSGSSSFRWQARLSSLIDTLPLRAQPLRVSGSQVHLLCFFKHFPSLGEDSDSLLPLLFLPWRRRLGERRRHLSCLRPALCRRRAHPPGMPAPSLSFFCARRSTPNPNNPNYLYSDLNPVTIYYQLTSISFARIAGG